MAIPTMFRNTALIAVFALATAVATPALADGPRRGYDRGYSGGHADVYFVYSSCGRPYVSLRYGYDRGYRFNRSLHRGGHAGYYGRPAHGQRYLRHSDGNRGHASRGDRGRRGHSDRSRHGRRHR